MDNCGTLQLLRTACYKWFTLSFRFFILERDIEFCRSYLTINYFSRPEKTPFFCFSCGKKHLKQGFIFHMPISWRA